MRSIHDFKQVFLHKAPVDGRRQINGLSAIVESSMKMNVFDGALFVFTNKRRETLKIVCKRPPNTGVARPPRLDARSRGRGVVT